MNIELNHSNWKIYNFNEIFTEYSKNNTENLEQFTVGKYGLIPKSAEGYIYDVQKHKIFEPHTLLLGIGAEEVGVATNERGCVSPIYNTFKISDNFDSLFLKYLMPIIISQHKRKISHISTRRNYEIEVSELYKLQIALPPLEIQKQISSLLFGIDNKIKKQEQLLNKFKSLKSSFLSKMFPIENQNMPQLRFGNFTLPWEQRKFEQDLISIHTGTNLLGSENNKGIPLLKMGNLQRGFFNFSKLEYLKKDALVKIKDMAYYGDFLFNTRNTLELVGKGATWMLESNKYAFNNNIARFKLRNIDTIFFNYLYNTQNVLKQVHNRAVGTTSVAAIYPRDLSSIYYFLPSIDEQIKIGKLFKTLDQLLTLHQRKPFYLNFLCNNLNIIKKFQANTRSLSYEYLPKTNHIKASFNI